MSAQLGTGQLLPIHDLTCGSIVTRWKTVLPRSMMFMKVSWSDHRCKAPRLRRIISLRVELAGMRKDVTFANRESPVNERRACKPLEMGRSSYRYGVDSLWP
jgi:hypothetical protein